MIRLKLLRSLSLLLLSISITVAPVSVYATNDEYEKYKFMVEAKQRAEAEYLQTVDTVIKKVNSEKEDAAYQELENLLISKASLKENKNSVAIEDSVQKSTESTSSSIQDFIKQSEELIALIKSLNNSNYVGQNSTGNLVGNALVRGEIVDQNYYGSKLVLTADSRKYLERLVEGEAGAEGYVGAALVAQTIHDTMIAVNCYDTLTIKDWYKYSGRIDREPCDDVKRAVAFIFDDGGMAVQHELRYFYAPALVSSKFHESQLFIVEHGGHRFFSER